jgi:hypothetical protein
LTRTCPGALELIGRRSIDNVIQVVLLTYVAVCVPYRIGFEHNTHPWEKMFIFDIFVDLYFVLDIVMSFRTAFYSEHGDIEYEPKVIGQVSSFFGCIVWS